MSSQRVAVTKRAKLSGMGIEATCLVKATEVSLPHSGVPPAYARMSIHDAPSDIPDGVYEVTFPGYKGQVRKRGSMWVAP